MKKIVKIISSLMILSFLGQATAISAHDHDDHANDSFAADHHHSHGNPYASFIPEKILNPDDSEYEAPGATADYVGLYSAEAEIDDLDTTLKMVLNIQEDGLFNLAYYFENSPEDRGLRFYANDANEILATEAIYQDLTLMTGALRQGDGGLGSGLIGETISPVVLLDSEGQPAELYAYMNMAYGLREQYANARVYQNVGLWLADDIIAVDINHLIGLDSDTQYTAQFQAAEADQLLVARPVFEILQDNFDNQLIDHNDFDMAYETANEFVQKVLAMHLETNTSFPQDTEIEWVEADNIQLSADLEADPVQYGMLINNQILYAHDGSHLYMASEFDLTDGQYTADQWVTNK